MKKAMNPPEDKALHQLVRRQLDGYQIPFQPEDWEEMRRTLSHKRRWYRLIWTVSLLGTGVVAGIIWWSLQVAPTVISHRKVTASSAPSFSKRSAVGKMKPVGAAPALATWKHLTSYITKKEIFVPSVDGEINSESSIAENRIQLSLAEMESRPIRTMPSGAALPQIPIVSSEEQYIQQQMLTGDYGSDSTSYQVLARNIRRWNNSVLVCDFTSSMYPYSTQLFAWFRQHAKQPSVQGMVFFTDCDSLGHETKKGGLKGKMFVTRERNTEKVLPLMLEAARNTLNNKDADENVVEALIEAQIRFPDAKQLILVADNSSGIKDLHRLRELQKPVRVVICGSTWNAALAFQPDFYELARQTNGSLHTIEDDFKPTSVSHRSWIKAGQRYYWYNARREKFVLSRFRERPTRVFGLFWF